MPLLGASDLLPHPPRRVLVAGTSGAGKSTLASAAAAQLGLPYVELDSLFHGPQWTPRPEFLDDVRAFSRRPTWVTEWQYKDARPMLLEHADTLVWLDHPRRVVMRRLVLRTARRRLTGEELWNGNSEPPLSTLFTDPEHLLRWAWKSHGRMRDKVTAILAGEHAQRLAVVRLRGQREVDEWRAGPLRRAAGRGEESIR
jgi:adenylate kinase family enzyme